MTTVPSPAVNSMCQFAWDCLPAALNTLGLASPPTQPFNGKGKGKGPAHCGGLRGIPIESSLPSKRQKTVDDWSGAWTGSWADSDDEDDVDLEAGYSSDSPSLQSLSLDSDSLADLLSLPAAVKPIFPTLDLSLGGADAPSAADPGRPPASPGANLTVVDGCLDWGGVSVVADTDDTDADDTDTDDDRSDEDWTPMRPLGITLPPRRRLVSVFAVSDRWGLSTQDAAEIMANFESAQGLE